MSRHSSSVMRAARSCNGCSWVHGLVWWWRDSPTPQHSPSAPDLCLSEQAKQQDRDLLANKLGTPGTAGKELCPVLCETEVSLGTDVMQEPDQEFSV